MEAAGLKCMESGGGVKAVTDLVVEDSVFISPSRVREEDI